MTLYTYIIIGAILLLVELLYFKIADHYHIINKPNERSSHSTIVIRGGGVIFAIAVFVWYVWQILLGEWGLVLEYLPFLVGLAMIAGVSFWDDIKSLPDRVRLVVQFVAMGLMFWSLMLMAPGASELAWYGRVALIVIALVVFVGATNVINFMDGINGITAGYAMAVLVPLLLLNSQTGFVEMSFLVVVALSLLVFGWFNFRPRGKARCFAGDVGSIGIAFILLYAIGRLIMSSYDASWLALLLVYGIDGCCTIFHRLMLHENLGQAHRKHAYQLMANELGMSHVTVSLIYMLLQLAISLVMIYWIPVAWHWVYVVAVALVLVAAYVLFMKKYYHLHEEYLQGRQK